MSIILNDTVDEILPMVHQTSLYFKLHDFKFWERQLVTSAYPNFFKTIQENMWSIEKNFEAVLTIFWLLWYIYVQDVVKMLGISNWGKRNVWSNKEALIRCIGTLGFLILWRLRKKYPFSVINVQLNWFVEVVCVTPYSRNETTKKFPLRQNMVLWLKHDYSMSCFRNSEGNSKRRTCR